MAFFQIPGREKRRYIGIEGVGWYTIRGCEIRIDATMRFQQLSGFSIDGADENASADLAVFGLLTQTKMSDRFIAKCLVAVGEISDTLHGANPCHGHSNFVRTSAFRLVNLQLLSTRGQFTAQRAPFRHPGSSSKNGAAQITLI